MPRVRMGATVVKGHLPPEVIQSLVRANFSKFRTCFEAGLDRNPDLEGMILAQFVITQDGTVDSVASDPRTDLPDPEVVECVLQSVRSLVFPEPEGGGVTVVYPIMFAPR